MSNDGTSAAGTPAKTLYKLEFHGSGGEYFRIWIVNIALTLLTLGIYSAWAKVRTTRYLRGNTYLAGHTFDYHASPVRILIGRAIAVAVLIAYGTTSRISPFVAIAWGVVFLFLTPWLVVSSIRFNARNTSYRNVRFNFGGTLGGAAKAYVLWPVLSAFTLFTTWPLVHRARDYYFINHHTFGGKKFHSRFSGWSIYQIYLLLLLLEFVVLGACGAIAFGVLMRTGMINMQTPPRDPATIGILAVLYLVVLFFFLSLRVFLHALSTNLAVNNTLLDGRHELRSQLGPVRMAWIAVTNSILVLMTLGIFYPWARVRLLRYEVTRMAVLAATDLDEFTSEAIATQGAIGEEIANFLDFGISL